jgi:hypothetical protein
MISSLLTDIYNNTLHKYLDSDEKILSYTIQMHFLELFNSVNFIKIRCGSIYYLYNEEVWFELVDQDLGKPYLYFSYDSIGFVLKNKYNIEYDDIQLLIHNVIEQHTELGSVIPIQNLGLSINN